MLLGDRRADGRAKEVGIQKVADVLGVEEIVTQRAVLLDRQTQPAEAGLGAVERHQNVIETEENRDLREHREAAQDWIKPVLALQLLHLQRHPLAVFAVLLLQRFDLWLQFLHLAGRPNLTNERLVEQRTQGKHQEHHRQRPGEEVLRPQDGREQLVPQPHDSRHRVVDVIEAEPVKHSCS